MKPHLSALAALLIGYTSSALATSFSPQPFSVAVQDAPVIVRGKVGTGSSDWGKDSDGGRRLFTFTELQVTEVFKGDVTSQHIVLRELGGEKDGVGLHVSGASEYERGEDVVVFLKEKNSEGSFDVQGMMMGKYNVESTPDGTEFLTGGGLVNEDLPQPGMPARSSKWTLEGLRKLIGSQKGHLRSPPPSPPPSQSFALTTPSPSSPSLLPPSLPTSSSAAPPLQSGVPVGLIILIVLGILVIIRLLLKISRRKK